MIDPIKNIIVSIIIYHIKLSTFVKKIVFLTLLFVTCTRKPKKKKKIASGKSYRPILRFSY